MPDLSYLTGDTENPASTPQTKAIPGREADMKDNRAGGVGFTLDKWSTLQRFLILGTEGATYYATQREMTTEGSKNVIQCIKEDGLRAVRIATEVSVAGRAPKNDQAIFLLALASVHGDEATRSAAYQAIPAVCRIGTHLFMFFEFRKALGKHQGGVTGGFQRALQAWYTEKDSDKLAYQLIKYQQRGGVSHRDLLRLSKPVGKEADAGVNAVLKWATRVARESDGHFSVERLKEFIPDVPELIIGFTEAKLSATPQRTADLVTQYRLPREALKTEHLNDPVVWEAMLDAGMPMTALIRNLATMTRIGLIKMGSGATRTVVDQIMNVDAIRKSRIHPITLFMALKTYGAGVGLRSSHTWVPDTQVIDALDFAFYKAFENVEPTGKRRMIGLDISGSMWSGQVAGIPTFTPAEAAGVMAMVSMKTGDPYEVYAFTSGSLANSRWGGMYGSREAPKNEVMAGLTPMSLSPRQRIDDVQKVMHAMSRYMGGTDVSLPVEWAIKSKREIDLFEIYTDNESWAGKRHASQALADYRKRSGIDAKLVSVAFTATNYSVADPKDGGMLDVVGFDTAAPQLISAFAEGAF